MFTSPCMISNDSCKQTIKFLIAILSFQPWLLIRQNCHVLIMAWLIDQRYFSISFWIKATVTSPYRSNVNCSKQVEKMNKLFSFNSANTTEKKTLKVVNIVFTQRFWIGPVTLNTVQIFKKFICFNQINADTRPGACFSKVPKVPKASLQETE